MSKFDDMNAIIDSMRARISDNDENLRYMMTSYDSYKSAHEAIKSMYDCDSMFAELFVNDEYTYDAKNATIHYYHFYSIVYIFVIRKSDNEIMLTAVADYIDIDDDIEKSAYHLQKYADSL